MVDELASEYIIRRKKKSLSFINNKGQMQFFRDILMRQYRKKRNKINYHIQEWQKFMTYDISHNQSNYTTLCLLLDTEHQADHFITGCGKWIFGSNL